jgi:hypothetical protein
VTSSPSHRRISHTSPCVKMSSRPVPATCNVASQCLISVGNRTLPGSFQVAQVGREDSFGVRGEDIQLRRVANDGRATRSGRTAAERRTSAKADKRATEARTFWHRQVIRRSHTSAVLLGALCFSFDNQRVKRFARVFQFLHRGGKPRQLKRGWGM